MNVLDIEEIFNNVCDRWSLTKKQKSKLFSERECFESRMITMLAISLGLQTLLGDSVIAERWWLNIRRDQHDNMTPLEMVVNDPDNGLKIVLDMVNKERNMW